MYFLILVVRKDIEAQRGEKGPRPRESTDSGLIIQDYILLRHFRPSYKGARGKYALRSISRFQLLKCIVKGKEHFFTDEETCVINGTEFCFYFCYHFISGCLYEGCKFVAKVFEDILRGSIQLRIHTIL